VSLEAINPNQFTLPGMEEHGHPLARHVAAGVLFKFGSDPIRSRNRVPNESPEDWKRRTRPPLAFDPPIREHELSAREAANPPHVLGTLAWAGGSPMDHSYPGEIQWVERHPGAYEGGDTSKPLHPGLMTSMFHAGHEIGMGQETVPVHSTNRTPFGEKWSKNVGAPELRPRRKQKGYSPPAGIHPYERAGSPRQTAPVMEGQLSLRGVAGHVLKEQREVDTRRRLVNRVGRIGEGQPAGRAVAIATFHNGVRVR
jgi:hypothetical protein